MKTYNSLISGFQIDPAYFNNLSPTTGRSTKIRYIIGRLSSRFTLYTRKQKRTSHPPPPPKRPQTAKWLFAAFLFFDNIPRNSLSNSRELWGILSNGCANFRCFYRKYQLMGKKVVLLRICNVVLTMPPAVSFIGMNQQVKTIFLKCRLKRPLSIPGCPP